MSSVWQGVTFVLPQFLSPLPLEDKYHANNRVNSTIKKISTIDLLCHIFIIN